MADGSRIGDIVPQNATDEQLVELYGEDAGYEVVALRALQARMLLGETDENGLMKVGPSFYDWATGKIDGRQLCEREGLAGFPPPAGEPAESAEEPADVEPSQS